MSKQLSVLSAVLLVLAIPAWLFLVVPQLVKLPNDFIYRAEVFSVDNFYDEASGDFLGEQLSVTQFSYETIAEEDGVIMVKNVFDVRTPSGDKIFSVERLYGIDPVTMRHVADYGDRDRDGYLFAPRGLVKGEPFTYWHINYDGPARMSFVAEEEILGLVVYRYETRYEGVDIDQTAELGHLPGVPEERGVNLESFLTLWVEPTTGRMVKYEDETVAYYYDQTTGARVHPWNAFNNRYTQSSVASNVRAAKDIIEARRVYNIFVPLGLGVLAVVVFVLGRRREVLRAVA